MLDLSITNKSFMTVKLENETLHILPPKRKLFTKMISIENNKADDADMLFDVATDILSNNYDKKTFTLDDVDDNFTIIDVKRLIYGYSDFVYKLISSPN